MPFANPFLQAARGLFGKLGTHADEFEERVDRFLSGLTPESDRQEVRRQTLAFMQENAVKFHLLISLRFHKLPPLSKEQRLMLYAHLDTLREAFEAYCFMQVPELDNIYFELFEAGIGTEAVKPFPRELQALRQMMAFFTSQVPLLPQPNSSFVDLLKAPDGGTLFGSCFTTVSLYLYLFALKHEINTLKIKAVPDFIFLHLSGVDIDTSRGQFTLYKEPIQEVIPVVETTAIDLLSITPTTDLVNLTPQRLLQAATFCFLVSDREEIISNNLRVAFRKCVLDAITKAQFDQALAYAQTSQDSEAVCHVGLKGASYYLQKCDFVNARRFGQFAKDKTKVLQTISHNEGVKLLNDRQYAKALAIFQKNGNDEYCKRCYAGLFLTLQKEIRAIKYLSELKKRRKTLLQMQAYAAKAEDQRMQQYTALLLKRIGG